MSNKGNTKKRRVEGGARVSIGGAGSGGDSSSAELSAIKSMMQELVQQNRTQTNMMQSMQGEITRLTEKCTTMETSIKSVKLSSKNMKSQLNGIHQRIDTIDNKIDGVEAYLYNNLKEVQSTNDERLKYHEILLKNQKWKYSAPYPSDEYWDGNDSIVCFEAEKFLGQIKTCTEEMRYGTRDTGMFKVDAYLPYNEVFLPHWKEFANALKQYQYYLERAKDNAEENETVLLLWNMELPDEVLDLLAKALESTFFKRMCLVNNNFGQKGVDFALDYFEKNKKLIEFGLVDNPINNMAVQRLCEIVKTHPSVKDLALNRCISADINGLDMMKQIINCDKKLTSLFLTHNCIRTGGDALIVDFIRKNTLTILKLINNHLDDNDAMMIASALKHNTNLRGLEIQNNNLTNAGWKTLQKAVYDCSSLNSAADSNHTCNIDFPSDCDYDTVREINSESPVHYPDPEDVRQKKIYAILSKRNRNSTNVDHFDDDMPVELLPDVLYSIQKYAGYHVPNSEGVQASPSQDPADVKPVSVMFEILQRWDKSLAVFEALSS